MPARWACAALAAAALLSASCKQGPTLVERPPGPAPTASDVEAWQQRRCAALKTLALRGHAELTWKDRSGGHFDDGDFELLLRQPMDSCLRVSKMGERVLWIGSDSEQWWLISPKEKPSRATLRRHGGPQTRSGVDGESQLDSLVAPRRLMDALGLSPIRADEVLAIQWDGQLGSWACQLEGRRVWLRGESLLPVGCEWLDQAGEVVAVCRLDRFEWPSGEQAVGESTAAVKALVATRIAIEVWNGARRKSHGEADASLSMAAQTPSLGQERMKEQFFRWDDAKRALNPEVIEGDPK